ncbi:sulfotransferase family 2 domain-containing protein [Niallia circulans]|uniref:sulfotransferase family 2 domain-containing protein n=1 Tax=Niallia circulans TaxID=1397 RepID=UPI0026EB4E53|nr:sulfotransferase family 2 domain-containing protein [Niallia circulans]
MEKQKRIIINIHIPKTAGSTLNSILNNQFKSEEKMDYYSGDYKKFIEKVNKNKDLKCINGHFLFGLHNEISEPYSYVTMLRQPIDRVISTYYYIKRTPEHPIYNRVKKMSIGEFINTKDTHANYLVSNMQTTYISGKYPPDLEEAKNNLLQHFDLVGITEMFDKSIFLMKKTFKWIDVNYKSMNVTNNRPSINQHSKDIIDLIKAKNQMDLELYEFGEFIFNQKIKNLDIKTQKELKGFLDYKNEDNTV